MLKKLRWQLSVLYVLAAAALVALIGGGAYGLLSYYFEESTDLALQYKIALEFARLGEPIPPDLQDADQIWQTSRTSPLVTRQPVVSGEEEREDHNDDDEHARQPADEDEYEEYYDSELASIFLITVDSQGDIISNPNTYSLPFQPDSQAVSAALAAGSDFRTTRQPDGSRVRLFTYRVDGDETLSVLQVGRSLKDQDRVLRQLLLGLVALGGVGLFVVGGSSWWLAGRSLIPAQQAWDRQQNFIANASHELRTPLTLVRASAEVARRGLDSQDSRYELLDDILGETDHMSRLVDDLLLLSRLDTGSLVLDIQPVDMAEFLGDLAREMGRVTAEGSVTLTVTQAQGVVLADLTRLRQVLLVLLDNALHHTSEGCAIRMEASSGERMVQIKVSDTGSGIPPQHVPHIFERFYRGEEDRSQSNHGSGLGLSIARGLVEAMHGQITLTSKPDQGTQVTIHLPAAHS